MQLVQDYVWILRGKSHEVAMLEREHGQDFWSQREDSWQSRPDGFWMKLLTEIVRNNYEEYKDSHKVAAGIVHGLREVEIQLDAAKLNLSGQETTKHNKSKPVAPFYMPPYPPRPDPELRQFSLSILHRDTQLIHKVTGKSASAPPAPAPRSSPCSAISCNYRSCSAISCNYRSCSAISRYCGCFTKSSCSAIFEISEIWRGNAGFVRSG